MINTNDQLRNHVMTCFVQDHIKDYQRNIHETHTEDDLHTFAAHMILSTIIANSSEQPRFRAMDVATQYDGKKVGYVHSEIVPAGVKLESLDYLMKDSHLKRLRKECLSALDI